MILYACVSDVRTKKVLAEHEDEDEIGENLGSFAVRCIESAPKFHLSYSHTSCNRIYAFLMDHQQQGEEEGGERSLSLDLIFFAIADVSLGSANTFFFLRCLRQAFTTHPSFSSSSSSSTCHLQLRRRIDDDLFLPVLHLLALDASLPPAAPSCQQPKEKKQGGGGGGEQEDKRRSLPVLTTFPTTDDEGYDNDNDNDNEQQVHSSGRSKGSKGKSRKKNVDRKEATQEEEEEEEEEEKGEEENNNNNGNIVNVSTSSHSRGMEEIISVVDQHHHHQHHHRRGHDLHIVHVRGKRSLLSSHRLWTQYVRLVLLIDLVVCTLLFGIWLSVCGGFHCITN